MCLPLIKRVSPTFLTVLVTNLYMGKTSYSDIKYLPNLALCYMLQQLPRKGPEEVAKIISKRNTWLFL